MTSSLDSRWHVLDISSVPVEEFASALRTLVPTLGWFRHSHFFAPFSSSVRFQTQSEPPLERANFALQRGFSNPLVRWTFRLAERLTETLLAHTKHPESSPLICTSPFYAPVADLWPGPVVYYSTDLTIAYDRFDPRQVLALDRRLCATAVSVCPNSDRIGEYLVKRADCDPQKLTCLPNATRRSHVLDRPSTVPSDLPVDIADLARPIAGVIGNLAANLDWLLLETVIRQAPWLSWVFVGNTSMEISDRSQRRARARLMQTGKHVRFVGYKPYGLLHTYARSFDVAVLPYLKREPTFSGSPTRFYEHLATCRPMLATRGVEQLSQREPLVHLSDTANDMSAALEQLKAAEFQDGFESIRWAVSRKETWLDRAGAMVKALQPFLPRTNPHSDVPQAALPPQTSTSSSCDVNPVNSFAADPT